MHTLPSCLCHYWSLRNGKATSLRGSTVKGSSMSGVIPSGTQVAITSQTRGQSLHVSPLISMSISPKLYHFSTKLNHFCSVFKFCAALHVHVNVFKSKCERCSANQRFFKKITNGVRLGCVFSKKNDRTVSGNASASQLIRYLLGK